MLDPKKNLSHLSFDERSRAVQLDMVILTNTPKIEAEFSETEKSETRVGMYSELNSPTVKGNESELHSPFSHSKVIHRKIMLPIPKHQPIRPLLNYIQPKTSLSGNPVEQSPQAPVNRMAPTSDFMSMNLTETRQYLAKYDSLRETLDKDGAVKPDYILMLKKVLGRVIRDLPAGSVFGERGIQGSLVRTASVVAKTMCLALVLPLKQFQIALKAASKERNARKMRLLHQSIPESLNYNYEQYFQFQYQFEEKTCAKDTEVISEGDSCARPFILAAGQCLISKLNTPASRKKLGSIIRNLEISSEHLDLTIILKDLLYSMSMLKTSEINIGFIGTGELAGAEILVPEIGQSIFTYRSVSSVTEYLKVGRNLEKTVVGQLCSTLLAKFKHRVNIIQHNTKAAKIAKNNQEVSESQAIEEKLEIPLTTKRVKIQLVKNMVKDARNSSFKISIKNPAEDLLARSKSSDQGNARIEKKKLDKKKDLIEIIQTESRNEQNKLQTLRDREQKSREKKTILEEDDELSKIISFKKI